MLLLLNMMVTMLIMMQLTGDQGKADPHDGQNLGP